VGGCLNRSCVLRTASEPGLLLGPLCVLGLLRACTSATGVGRCLIKMKQLEMGWATWGGKRPGAGRPRRAERASVVHRRRPVLKARFPVHVTWRMREGVWGLRKAVCFKVLARAFWRGGNRFGFRLIHYSVQGNHLHLLAEAEDERSLARGMNGLGVRVARGLNRLMKRRGKVLEDRYHGHILRTPTEVRRARSYLLQNAQKHVGWKGLDPCTSRVWVVAPVTWLMRKLC
jgi:putative transposase